MAKLEVQNIKKQKAKKRKHSSTGNEDEVANKSVILEVVTRPEQEVENTSKPAEEVITKISKKRKNRDNGAVKKKRSKSQEPNADDEEQHEAEQNTNQDGNDIQQPTLEELKESEKPENNIAIVTGRQKKKQKRQKLLVAQKDQSVEREKLRNDEYLKRWKHSREDWKFEKLRQISIQQTMFEETKLNAEVWCIALDYLAGSKGAAKDKIVKIANDVIDGIDKLCENLETEDERQELLNSVKYQRARDLLQIFD